MVMFSRISFFIYMVVTSIRNPCFTITSNHSIRLQQNMYDVRGRRILFEKMHHNENASIKKGAGIYVVPNKKILIGEL